MEAPRVVVLGAGPGGLSAALWCASLGLDVTVLGGRERAGGQLHEIPGALDNLPGLPAANAGELAQTLTSQVMAGGVELRYGHSAVLAPDALHLRCDARRAGFDAAAVVIATGVRRRTLGIPGERSFLGRGVS